MNCYVKPRSHGMQYINKKEMEVEFQGKWYLWEIDFEGKVSTVQGGEFDEALTEVNNVRISWITDYTHNEDGIDIDPSLLNSSSDLIKFHWDLISELKTYLAEEV